MGEIRERKSECTTRDKQFERLFDAVKKSVPIFLLGELWNITILDKNICNSG